MVKKKTKEKHKYIFPDFIAKVMSKVDLRTQYEASMMSMSLMSIGLIVTITYLFIYVNFALWYKIVLVINGLAGILFMWSYITTTYQQYKAYMETIDFQREMKGGRKRKHGIKKTKEKTKGRSS